MPYILRGWRLLAVLFVVWLVPVCASAQDVRPSLKAPTIAASIAAAADWASTYHAMSNYHLRETNVFLQAFQNSPGRLVTVGAAIDVATFSTWNMVMGPRHPKIASAGLWAMAAFRTALVVHNLRNEQKAVRRAP